MKKTQNQPTKTLIMHLDHNYTKQIYRVAPKMAQFLLNPLTLSNIDRFSKFFHSQCQNQQKICKNIITKDPTTPQVCRYTTLPNVSVLNCAFFGATMYIVHCRISCQYRADTFLTQSVYLGVAWVSLRLCENVHDLTINSPIRPAGVYIRLQ